MSAFSFSKLLPCSSSAGSQTSFLFSVLRDVDKPQLLRTYTRVCLPVCVCVCVSGRPEGKAGKVEEGTREASQAGERLRQDF